MASRGAQFLRTDRRTGRPYPPSHCPTTAAAWHSATRPCTRCGPEAPGREPRPVVRRLGLAAVPAPLRGAAPSAYFFANNRGNTMSLVQQGIQTARNRNSAVAA